MNRLKSWFSKNSKLLLFVVLFGAIGSAMLFYSFAAVPVDYKRNAVWVVPKSPQNGYIDVDVFISTNSRYHPNLNNAKAELINISLSFPKSKMTCWSLYGGNYRFRYTNVPTLSGCDNSAGKVVINKESSKFFVNEPYHIVTVRFKYVPQSGVAVLTPQAKFYEELRVDCCAVTPDPTSYSSKVDFGSPPPSNPSPPQAPSPPPSNPSPPQTPSPPPSNPQPTPSPAPKPSPTPSPAPKPPQSPPSSTIRRNPPSSPSSPPMQAQPESSDSEQDETDDDQLIASNLNDETYDQNVESSHSFSSEPNNKPSRSRAIDKPSSKLPLIAAVFVAIIGAGSATAIVYVKRKKPSRSLSKATKNQTAKPQDFMASSQYAPQVPVNDLSYKSLPDLVAEAMRQEAASSQSHNSYSNVGVEGDVDTEAQDIQKESHETVKEPIASNTERLEQKQIPADQEVASESSAKQPKTDKKQTDSEIIGNELHILHDEDVS